jgi:hypothetical protein
MLSSGTCLGPYEILAPLGAGGMGEVYRARDTRLGREVAIKVLPASFAFDPERLRRFEQEARAASTLNHANILVVYDVGTHEGSPFLVEELLEGQTLRQRLSEGALPVRKVIEIAAQIANGLAAAHERGIVHRDLKPDNLFLTKDGVVKVLDFGLAKLAAVGPSAPERPVASIAATETAPGVVLGTAGYMAPEQVRGEPADHRSDVFALGCVLHEMVTGVPAFRRGSSIETMNAILKEEPPDLTTIGAKIPPNVARLVQHCLEKEPGARFQSVRDLAFDLETIARPTDGAAFGGPTLSAIGRRSRARRVGVAAALVPLVIAGAVAAFLAGRRVGDRTHASRVRFTRLTVDRGRVFSARFSPDGESVFYAAAWNGRPVEVFEARPGVPASRSLGLPQADLLAISKSGTMVVSLGHSSWVGFYPTWGTLAEVAVTGEAPRRLLDDVLSGDFSPNGVTLAVVHRVGGKARLEMPPGRVLYETSGGLTYLRAAPSGKWLAFAENPVPPDNRGSVVITDSTGKVVARTGEWQGITGLAWSPDGAEIWFTASEEGETTDLTALRPDGSERVVGRFPGWMALHDIGHEGQVLLAREVHHHDIWGRSSDGEAERRLGWLDVPVAADLSRDGQTLLMSVESIGGGSL